MNAAKISAGEAYVSISCDSKLLQQGLRESSRLVSDAARSMERDKLAPSVKLDVEGADKVRDALRGVRDEVDATSESSRKLSDRFVVTAGDIFNALKSVAGSLSSMLGATGDQFDKMSLRTGLSTETLSEYAHAASMCGASVETVESAIKSMGAALVSASNGSSRSKKAFDELGINLETFAKLSPEGQFERIAAALGAIESPTERAGLAMRVFGGAGQQLLPLFAQGADGLKNLRQEARELGVSVDSASAKLGADYVDASTRFRESISGASLAIARVFTPSIVDFFNKTAGALASVRAWAAENPDLIRGITTAGAAILGAVGVIQGYSLAITVATKATAAFSAVAALNPAILALAGLTAALIAGAAALDRSVASAAKYSTAAKDALEAGDRERQADEDRLRRLEELREKQTLSNGEIEEAARLANELRERYGDVGIEVDSVTGKIKIANDAQRKMTEEMIKAQRAQLQAALEEARRNAREDVVKETVYRRDTSAWQRAKANTAAAAYNMTHDDSVTGMDILLNSETLGDSSKFRELVKLEQQKNDAALKDLEARIKRFDELNKRAEEVKEKGDETAAARAAEIASAFESENAAQAQQDAMTAEERALNARIDKIESKRKELLGELLKLANVSGDVDFTNADELDKLAGKNATFAGLRDQFDRINSAADKEIERVRSDAQKAQETRARDDERPNDNGDAARIEKENADKIARAFERFATPFEKFEAAAKELEAAEKEMQTSLESGDRSRIAASLDRLGEATDKYASTQDVVSAINKETTKSVGGTFNAWQAAAARSTDWDKSIYKETRVQTDYLKTIANRLGRLALGFA